MVARPSWHGHLRLSLVSCPVALFGATTAAADIHFHLINPKTGSRVRMITLDAETGSEVSRKDLVRGYEYEKGSYVLLTDEELRSVRLESTQTIDIERFVDAAEIDRIWWNEPYYLVPDGKAGIEAYEVIRDAMAESRRIALGRVVMHTRERLVAIEPRDNGMLLTTLRTHDEVVDPEPIFHDIPSGKRDRRMLEIADKIIEQQHGAFEPAAFIDRYEDALRALITAKQQGEAKAPSTKAAADNVVDLMDALRRSLQGANRDRGDSAAAKRKAAPSREKDTEPKAAAAAVSAARRRRAAR